MGALYYQFGDIEIRTMLIYDFLLYSHFHNHFWAHSASQAAFDRMIILASTKRVFQNYVERGKCEDTFSTYIMGKSSLRQAVQEHNEKIKE